MKEIKLSDVLEINDYWLIYRNENKEKAYIDLSASANSFSRVTQQAGTDGLRSVGQRYEENGVGYYELYNIGHTRISCPMKAGFMGFLSCKLSGKDPVQTQRETFLSLEERLNAVGWRTVER